MDTANFCASCGARLPAAPSSPHAAAVIPRGDERRNAQARTGLILGIVSLFAWLLAVIGFPVSIAGIILNTIGLKSQKRGWAVAGLVMSILGLIGTFVAAFGPVMGWPMF